MNPIFKPGDKVQVVTQGTPRAVREFGNLYHEIGQVIRAEPSLISLLDGGDGYVYHTTIHPKVRFESSDLKKVEDGDGLGSWDEITKLIGHDIRKELEYVK